MLRCLSLLSLLLAGSAAAQPNVVAGADTTGPRSAVERFLALNAESQLQSNEGQTLLAGELEDLRGSTVGTLPAADRIVALADGSAVARLPAADADSQDLYLYLRQDRDGWAIHAVRSLALTGVLHELRRLLLLEANRTAEQDKSLREVELTLSPDRRLREWFTANFPALEHLRGLMASGEGESEAETLVRALDCAHVGVTGGRTILTIGGMVDNGVGFLHSDDPARIPPIDDHDHIWVEPVGHGWYLFRTT